MLMAECSRPAVFLSVWGSPNPVPGQRTPFLAVAHFKRHLLIAYILAA